MAEPLRAFKADPYSYDEAHALTEALGVSEAVAITLVRRGYRTPDEARRFLSADEEYSPDEFDGMAEVADTVLAAAEAGARVTVHGDFDVDGVCSTAILVGTLRRLGAECDWLIPDRMADGYGLSTANVERLASRGTELLITVDCGITSVAEVAAARELGMEVVVTDHHQPGDELPDCLILHPVVSGYPCPDLCGTGVAWKLASALSAMAGQPDAALGRPRPRRPRHRRGHRLPDRGEPHPRPPRDRPHPPRPPAGAAGADRGGILRALADRRGRPLLPPRASHQRRRAASTAPTRASSSS